MTRILFTAFLVVTVAYLICVLSKDGAIVELESDRDSLQVVIAASDAETAALLTRLVADSTVRDSLRTVADSLQVELDSAAADTVTIMLALDSLRTEIPDSTVSPRAQRLLAMERLATQAQRRMAQLEREMRVTHQLRADTAESVIAEITRRLWDVRAERDSAMALANRAIDELDPGFFGSLVQDLPMLVGCTGSGLLVASLSDGDALGGAMIGLGTCLAAKAIFK